MHLDESGEVPAIVLQFALVVMNDVSAHIIQKGRVVADNEAGHVLAKGACEVLLQPSNVVHVQVVGGLVCTKGKGIWVLRRRRTV